MATSTIPNPNKIESAQMGGTDYTAQCRYLKQKCTKYNDKYVHVELACSFDIDIPMQTLIASLPQGYRPATDVSVPAMMRYGSTWFAGNVSITSAGRVTQGLTSTLRECFVDGWFDI